jgi:uncharacterized protein (TIGR02444 family)
MRHFTMSSEKMAGQSGADSLWDFSVCVYARPGVEEICIRLQDDWHADIPVLLFALWRGRQGRVISNSGFLDIAGAVSVWQRDVIAPIRQLRRRLRHLDPLEPALAEGLQSIRSDLKETELGAERRELEYLATIEVGATHEPIAATISANITTYLDFLEVPKGDQKECVKLVDAASL